MAHAERTWLVRSVSVAVALLLCTVVLAGPLTAPAQALPSIPNPCELPVVGNVCDAVSSAVTKVAPSGLTAIWLLFETDLLVTGIAVPVETSTS